VVMGDLVLLESELTPVMKKLRTSGFDITAVHNHVLTRLRVSSTCTTWDTEIR